MQLPSFRYHPDPIATGSVTASSQTCDVCGQTRGYIYTGHVYGAKSRKFHICPWCIADGTAHEKFGVMFFDNEGVGGYEDDAVSLAVIDEIAFRTPGFSGWQQEQWLAHCGDAAAFLGRVGFAELNAFGPEAIQAIQDDTGMSDGKGWDKFFQALDKNDAPRAYLFRCLHCGAYIGYTDTD